MENLFLIPTHNGHKEAKRIIHLTEFMEGSLIHVKKQPQICGVLFGKHSEYKFVSDGNYFGSVRTFACVFSSKLLDVP